VSAPVVTLALTLSARPSNMTSATLLTLGAYRKVFRLHGKVFREMAAVCFQNGSQHIDTLWGQNAGVEF
jgi:hypothetical protein